MTALITLLTVLLLSLAITRVATIALALTGLSRESARFQARSAFTGAGFTTSESEFVVRHPVRRRIVMYLMLAGNAGIVAVVGSLLLTFVDAAPENWTGRLAVLIGGLLLLWLLATSSLVDRAVSRLTTWALRRWTDVDVTDYAELLHIAGEYRVVELSVEPGNPIAGKTLAELNLRERGMLTLGIEAPDGKFIGVPPLSTRVEVGHRLTIYGRTEALETLDRSAHTRRAKARSEA